MKKIYFAGPLFNEAEKNFNASLVSVLEEFGYLVFLPQRDGFEATMLEGLTEIEKTEKIFRKDISEIDGSDILFMVLDGRTPDEGACVELGYAYAKGKSCYGIKTDVRAIEYDMSINPMLVGCFKEVIFCNQVSASESLKDFLHKTRI